MSLDDGTPGDARDQRAQQMRARILAAAAAVFSRKGFHQARTREIAAEAGVAEGTIYNYFPSKRDLLMAMLKDVAVPSLLEILATSESMDLRSLLTAILRDRLSLMQRFRGIAIVLLTELATDEDLRRRYLAEVVAPLAVTLQSRLRPRPPRDPAVRLDLTVVLPALIGGAALSMAAQNFLPLHLTPLARERLSDEQFVHRLVDFFLLGLEGRPSDASCRDGLVDGAVEPGRHAPDLARLETHADPSAPRLRNAATLPGLRQIIVQLDSDTARGGTDP